MLVWRQLGILSLKNLLELFVKAPPRLGLLIRVTFCLENLEVSGNYTDVREMSEISLKVMEMSEFSGKKSCHGKLPKNFHEDSGLCDFLF